MKIAISSKGNNPESEVDIRFGRCDYFLILDVDEKNKKITNFKAIKNIAQTQTGGAGITAGEIVAKQKVDAIITVNVGPRAYSVFEQFGIKIYQAEGKIKDVVQKFLNGKLKEVNNATGPQHAGLR